MARGLGFAEAYFWNKAEIEDRLFQPKKDHLLFAYFGVSLQTRGRTLKTEARTKLATKRKALRGLKPIHPTVESVCISFQGVGINVSPLLRLGNSLDAAAQEVIHRLDEDFRLPATASTIIHN